MRARLDRQLLHQRDELGVAPIAVAREAHGLPRRTVDGQRRGACETSLGVEADGSCRHGRRGLGRAEQLLGRRPRGLDHFLLDRLLARLGGHNGRCDAFLGYEHGRDARCQSERTREAG